jgi:hypothetical protein
MKQGARGAVPITCDEIDLVPGNPISANLPNEGAVSCRDWAMMTEWVRPRESREVIDRLTVQLVRVEKGRKV